MLECVSVPRASVSLAFSPVKLSPSSVSSISARRRLPEFKGLKVFPTRSFGSVSYSQSSSLKFGRGGRIVCEAQETAVDGEDRTSIYQIFFNYQLSYLSFPEYVSVFLKLKNGIICLSVCLFRS